MLKDVMRATLPMLYRPSCWIRKYRV